MPEEPVEVEVLDKDGEPVVPAKKHSLLNPVNALMFAFAALTAVFLLLAATAVVLEQKMRSRGDPPPDPE